MINLIKEYQTLIGSFIGALSPVALWFLYKLFEKKEAKKDSKKEIEKIFLAASRECDDSIKNLLSYIDNLKKSVELNNKNFKVTLPPRFNRVIVNEDHLVVLSRNLHHFISQQIDIANSAVKKFNGWLDQFERMPEFLFDGSLKMLQVGLDSKETIIRVYYNDLNEFIKMVSDHMNEHAKTIQLHLLRPVFVLKEKKAHLEKLFYSDELENYLDKIADTYLFLNKDKL
jgi:hypothetical protein